jgi:hypothetical protein
MAKTKTAPRPADIDWFEAEEVPRPGMPDGIKLAKKQSRYRKLVWSSVILAPVALVAVVVAAGAKPATPTPHASNTAAFASSPGRNVATAELTTWLAEIPSPLPGGALLSWDGATAIPNVTPPTTPGSASGSTPAVVWTAEVDHFTVVATAGVFAANVEVALDPRGGAIALSGPSITPTTPVATDNWDAGAPWPGLTATNTITSSVTGAINGWVQAYTSGDAATLGLSVGDTNPNHGYVPLSGVSTATAVGNEAATLGPASADQIVVEVSLNVVWSGESTATTQPKNNAVTPPKMTMDLLVERASTAAPVVVAWGAAGTGPTLKPYSNAVNVTGRQLPGTTPGLGQ